MPDRVMITDPDVFFDKGCGRCDRFATPDCSTRLWLPGLLTLRRICRGAGLVEVAKWGHPCYMHADRNVTPTASALRTPTGPRAWKRSFAPI